MVDNNWVRMGDCNHCGWCCENLGVFELQFPITEDVAYMEIRGFTIKDNLALIKADIKAPCPAHIDNRCSVYDTRPDTCKEFPSEPNEIIQTPCSYYFENSLTGEKIGGKQSPFPTEIIR